MFLHYYSLSNYLNDKKSFIISLFHWNSLRRPLLLTGYIYLLHDLLTVSMYATHSQQYLSIIIIIDYWLWQVTLVSGFLRSAILPFCSMQIITSARRIIDCKNLRIIKILYWEQTAAVEIDEEHTSFTSMKRDVRQGCVLSPAFFNLYNEMILWNTLHLKGMRIGRENINKESL